MSAGPMVSRETLYCAVAEPRQCALRWAQSVGTPDRDLRRVAIAVGEPGRVAGQEVTFDPGELRSAVFRSTLSACSARTWARRHLVRLWPQNACPAGCRRRLQSKRNQIAPEFGLAIMSVSAQTATPLGARRPAWPNSNAQEMAELLTRAHSETDECVSAVRIHWRLQARSNIQ